MRAEGLTPFHLAIRVDDLERAREFYGELLGCPEGRSAPGWVDFNLYGHQLVCHHTRGVAVPGASSAVDGDDVPVPHFGVVLRMDQWKALAARLESAKIDFVVKPRVRFAGETGEQATMFLRDPSGNAIEFKAFRNIERELFASA